MNQFSCTIFFIFFFLFISCSKKKGEDVSAVATQLETKSLSGTVSPLDVDDLSGSPESESDDDYFDFADPEGRRFNYDGLYVECVVDYREEYHDNDGVIEQHGYGIWYEENIDMFDVSIDDWLKPSVVEQASEYKENYFWTSVAVPMLSSWLFDIIETVKFARSGDDTYSNVASHVVPVAERRVCVDIEDAENNDSALPFFRVLHHISRHRGTFDFYGQYKENISLVRKILTREVYSACYDEHVNFLLMAYDDIQNDEELLSNVRVVMKKHEECISHPDFRGESFHLESTYPAMKDFIPVKSHSLMIVDDEADYYNAGSLVWYYSFWLRRSDEGSTKNVNRLLKAIQEDYLITK